MNDLDVPIPVIFKVGERGMSVIHIPQQELAAASDEAVQEWFACAEAMIRAAKDGGTHILLIRL